MATRIDKIFSIFLYLLLGAIFLFSVTLVWPVYKQYEETRNEVERLEEQYKRIHEERGALKQEVHDLEHNPAAVERAAREKLRYCREGEEVYIYSR